MSKHSNSVKSLKVNLAMGTHLNMIYVRIFARGCEQVEGLKGYSHTYALILVI